MGAGRSRDSGQDARATYVIVTIFFNSQWVNAYELIGLGWIGVPFGAKRSGDATKRLGAGGTGPGPNAVRVSGVSTFFTRRRPG